MQSITIRVELMPLYLSRSVDLPVVLLKHYRPTTRWQDTIKDSLFSGASLVYAKTSIPRKQSLLSDAID